MDKRTHVGKLILVPGVITLAVTVVRLVGELEKWSKAWFNPEPGLALSRVSVAWLPFVFGPYFGLRLARAGSTPGGGPVSLEGQLLVAVGFILAIIGFPKALNSPLVKTQLIGELLVALATLALFLKWPEFWMVTVAYAYSARVPEVIVSFFAIRFGWRTHYGALPAGYQGPFNFWPRFAFTCVLPETITWIAYTVFASWLAALFVIKERTKF